MLPKQKNVELAFWVAAEFNGWKTTDCRFPGTGASGVASDPAWSLPVVTSVYY